jgi:general secretion pathway protein G
MIVRPTQYQGNPQMADSPDNAGFTLIELLVVMAILALLLTLATPQYFKNVDKSKEAVLRNNLSSMREAIDKYYADTGKYPEVLDDLVTKKYMRKSVLDPITESTLTWIIVPPEKAETGGVYDIRSGAPGIARDGTTYKDW